MSLVAYASSDESEPDEAEPEEEAAAAAPTSGPALGGLFASLPAPKGPALLPPPPQMLAPAFPPPLLLPPPGGDPRLQPPPPLPFGLGGFPPPPGVSPAEAAGVGEGLALGLPSARGPGLSLPPAVAAAGPPLGLPKPKKRTEPVKIAAPELHQGDVSTRGGRPQTAHRAWASAAPAHAAPEPWSRSWSALGVEGVSCGFLEPARGPRASARRDRRRPGHTWRCPRLLHLHFGPGWFFCFLFPSCP